MSEVQICNRALTTYLGAGRIASLTESTPAAEQCNIHYAETVTMLLERHWWNFATGRETLAALTNDRPEWGYKYQMPASALAIRWVNDPSVARQMMATHQSPDCSREITEDAIYCDVVNAACEFTKPVGVAAFPQYFKEAVSASLAAAMAIPLTEDVKRAKYAQDMAVSKLDDAIALDERNTPVQEGGPVPDWLSVRGIY